MPESDYYSILQVSPEAEPEVIKLAYKALAKKYHPDKCSMPDREERMQRINEAYEVLGDPLRRANYDRSRPSPEPAEVPSLKPDKVPPASVSTPAADPEKARMRLGQLFLGSILLVAICFGLQSLWGYHGRQQAAESYEAGRFEECVRLVSRSIDGGSRDASNFLLRARCFNRLEQPEQALVDLDNALGLGAAAEEVALERVQALEALDRLEEALSALEGLKGERVEEARARLQTRIEEKGTRTRS